MSQPYPGHPGHQLPPDPNAGLRRAGTVAIWVWVLLALVPVICVVGCIGFCLVGGVIGSLTPTPTPSVTP